MDPTLQVQPSEKKQFTGPESPYPTGSDYSKPWLAAGKAGKERAAAKKAEEVGKAKKEREAAKKAEEVENAKKDQAVDEKRRYLARWTAEMLEELEGMSNPSGGGKRRRRTKRKKSMRKKKSTKKRRTKSSKRKSRRRR